MAMVYSPIFKKEFPVSDLASVVKGVCCPIDQTELTAVDNRPDSSNYQCPACGATYPYGTKDPAELSKYAKEYIEDTRKTLKCKQNELDEEHSKLKRIIIAAQTTRLLKE